jgi:hypothetical protein
MNTSAQDAARDEMREQLIALIYEKYLYFRTYFGKEDQTALTLKNLILDIREDQAKEIESQNEQMFSY